MGAPKQKWTAEEEATLKAGVRKHGTGKWRTILMDPEFGSMLHLRSNVDLKDKWRNINVTAIWGSRQKAKLALKRTKHDENSKALTIAHGSDEENGNLKPLALSNGTRRNGFSKDLLARLDDIVLQAIATLKEPGGSDKVSITSFIEEKYEGHPNLRKLLVGKLKFLTANGKLIKVKHKYRIPPSMVASEGRKNSPHLLTEGKQKDSFKLEKDNAKPLTKSQVDQDLCKIRSMTAEEAAAAAAKAVSEAEAAIAEAEAAAREAEAAEVEAEAAKVFEKAAIKAFKYGHVRYPYDNVNMVGQWTSMETQNCKCS